MILHQDEKHIALLSPEAVRDYYLFQHVRGSTRYRSDYAPSNLDLMLANKEDTMCQIITLVWVVAIMLLLASLLTVLLI